MNSKAALIWVIFGTLGLSGCASMSGDECVTGNWQAIGYEDGVRGYTGDRIATYRKACAKHGVAPDLTLYQSGREQGLQEYCQPGRGFSVGSSGAGYNGVCSVELEDDFLDAYNTGYHLYTLRSNVNNANSAIHSREDELEQMEASVHAKEIALISPETTTEGRIVLLADIKGLAERRGRLEAELRDLYEDRAFHVAELDRYQLMLADLGY